MFVSFPGAYFVGNAPLTIRDLQIVTGATQITERAGLRCRRGRLESDEEAAAEEDNVDVPMPASGARVCERARRQTRRSA